jgi:pimeloyl-ACP methyl ester carboxylesterase
VLRTLNVPPPYILVGHSWGGVLIQYFAAEHQGEVVGLLYIDPTDLHESESDIGEVASQIGAPVEALAGKTDSAALMRAPAPIRAEWQAIRALLDGDINVREIPAPLAVPTIVVNSTSVTLMELARRRSSTASIRSVRRR